MAEKEVNILWEAREIVRTQPMSLRVGHLRTCADELHAAYDALKTSCTRTAAEAFVAALTRTLVAIDRVHAHEPPTPTGGRLTEADAQVALAKEIMGC